MTRKRVVWSAALLLLGLAGLLLGAGYVATQPSIAPTGSRRLGSAPADLGLAADVVSFVSRDGIDLKGWWIPARPGPPRGTVILAHGRDANRSYMVSRARFLVAAGYNAFPIDLRGHGESGGRYMTPGYLEALDILGAVDAARHRGARGPFVALGHSSGAVASLQAAARSPEIAAVIADGAFYYLDAPVKRMGAMDVPVPFSPVLEDQTVPTAEKVVDMAKSLCGRV